MSDHFVALHRGVEGSKYSDFLTGTSSTSTALFEVRILDGVTPTKTEVNKAMEAFERFFENSQQLVAAGFDVKG
jgi:hypothetical protein